MGRGTRSGSCPASLQRSQVWRGREPSWCPPQTGPRGLRETQPPSVPVTCREGQFTSAQTAPCSPQESQLCARSRLCDTQLLGPLLICGKAALILAKQKQTTKIKHPPAPDGWTRLSQMDLLLSAAPAPPGRQADAPRPPLALGLEETAQGWPSLSPTDPQEPHSEATEVTGTS